MMSQRILRTFVMAAILAGALGNGSSPLGSADNVICLSGATYVQPLSYPLLGIKGGTYQTYTCPPIDKTISKDPTTYESLFVYFSMCLPIATYVTITTTVKDLPIAVLDSLGSCTDLEGGITPLATVQPEVSRTFEDGCYTILIPQTDFNATDYISVSPMDEGFGYNSTYCILDVPPPFDGTGIPPTSSGTDFPPTGTPAGETPPVANPGTPEPSTSPSPEPSTSPSPEPGQEPPSGSSSPPNEGLPCGGNCVETYGQCGGVHYTSTKVCCSSMERCVKKNDYYSQCRPISKETEGSWNGEHIESACP